MGEFPWQVRVGESVMAEDYIAPPVVVSSEASNGEVVWSAGTYTSGATIWKAFNLQGSPPHPKGIYANQSSPYTGRVASLWKTYLILMALLMVFVIGTVVLTGMERQVFSQRYAFDTTSTSERSFVTPIFDITQRHRDVEVEIKTDLANDWAFFGLALISDDTGIAYDLGKEVSHYFGIDGGEYWTEGGQTNRARFPNVPPGRYYLRVEPDMENDGRRHSVNYTLSVKSGVPSFGWFLVPFFLLPIPAIVFSLRAFNFENQRWAESDYGALISSSSGSEED
jgi:hypothetical protein